MQDNPMAFTEYLAERQGAPMGPDPMMAGGMGPPMGGAGPMGDPAMIEALRPGLEVVRRIIDMLIGPGAGAPPGPPMGPPMGPVPEMPAPPPDAMGGMSAMGMPAPVPEMPPARLPRRYLPKV